MMKFNINKLMRKEKHQKYICEIKKKIEAQQVDDENIAHNTCEE